MISGDKPLRIKNTEDIWAARVDADLRILFTSRGDEIVILDIISRSDYLRYMP
jgi:Txe/YoeB family toxin of Txe-Axe toxin-antitoxin module